MPKRKYDSWEGGQKIKPLQLYTGYRWDNLNKQVMKENDKYYTPSIKEFHVGFECEVSIETSHGQYENKINWYPIIIGGKDRYSLLVEAEFHTKLKINLNKFRVKYLDKEDIKSLGFKPDHVGTIHNDKGYDMMQFDNHIISIYISNPHNGITVFRGTIKNKIGYFFKSKTAQAKFDFS
jgi:hypothetical protein